MVSALAKIIGRGELIECQPPGDSIWWQLRWAVTRHWLVLSRLCISHIRAYKRLISEGLFLAPEVDFNLDRHLLLKSPECLLVGG